MVKQVWLLVIIVDNRGDGGSLSDSVCVCVFHNFELLRCYICTIQFLVV